MTSRFQSFDELIDALQGAVIQAYTLSKNQHIHAMKDYFDEDGVPHMVKIKLPYKSEEGGKEGEIKYRTVEIPAFSLVPQVSLKMHKVNMDFDVKLVGLSQEASNQPESSYGHISDSSSGRNLNLRNKKSQKLLTNVFAGTDDSNKVHVELEFTSGDPPEGVVRMNDMLIRLMP